MKRYKRKDKGITLVALVVTIIILLILAGITISQLTESGLFSKAIEAKNETQKMQTKEELERVLMEAAIERQENEEYNSNDFLNQFIISKITGSQINGNNVLINNYNFLIDRELLKIISISDTENIKLKENAIELIKISNEEEILGNNGNKVESKTEYNIEIEEKPSSAQITWKSSDENIVSVDQNGKIKFVNAGTATITCTAKTKTGIEYTDSCEVTALERLYLYYYGNQFTNITGGYEECARSGKTFSATFNEDNIYINCYGNAGGGGVYTTNKINVTNYKNLKAYGSVTARAYNDSYGRILATTSTSSWGSAWYPSGHSSLSTTNTILGENMLVSDITSLESSYYICNGFNQSHGYIYEIWLEK